MDQYSLYVSENKFTLRLYSVIYIVLLHYSCFCYLNLGLVTDIWRVSVWTGPPNTQLNIPLSVKQ